MGRLFIALMIVFLASVGAAGAATIYGSIYDNSINKVNYAIVEVNSSPHQRLIAVNGTYQFELPVGSYKITGIYSMRGTRMRAEENVRVDDDGIYILDLFLYPDLTEDEELYSSFNFSLDTFDQPDKPNSLLWFLVPLAIIMLAFLALLIRINRKLSGQADAADRIAVEGTEKILELLKKNEGRMTQKDIRGNFPLSEAKVSLMIAELESTGKVQKIKRGRGNIILLKK